MRAHPLDNMIWNALTTRQARLGFSNGFARRFHPAIAMFVAVEHPLASLHGVAEIITPGEVVGLVTTEPLSLPPELEPVGGGEVLQLTAEHFAPVPVTVTYRDLTAADVPAMIELVQLTKPGPFAARTHEMGHYIGVFDGPKLIAMAGERLHLDGFGEVSAVCTHPDYQGRGLAKQLVSVIGSEIVARGETPFLQAFAGNEVAIATYIKLGFTPRRTLTFTTVKRG